MSALPEIVLTFRIRRQWRGFLVLTFVGVLLYQLTTLQRGADHDFASLLRGNVAHYLKMLLGYYYLFELLSVVIFVWVLLTYQRLLGIRSVRPTAGAVLRYELMMLPAFLLAICLFGPITNTLRYLVIFYPDYRWSAYFPEYVLTGRMIANYLLPFLMVGYGFLNLNLFLDYNAWQKQHLTSPTLQTDVAPDSPAWPTHVDATDDEGECRLPVADIWYIEVEQKQYFAYTQGHTYHLRRTLAELEKELDPRRFYRINRSVLLNVAFVKNYSFWEHDKYILRLTDGKTEFVTQRTRLRGLKDRLAELPQLTS